MTFEATIFIIQIIGQIGLLIILVLLLIFEVKSARKNAVKSASKYVYFVSGVGGAKGQTHVLREEVECEFKITTEKTIAEIESRLMKIFKLDNVVITNYILLREE